MKVLIVYPNLPMMITPATSVAIFTSILRSKGCAVDLFETTLYSDHENSGMLYKSKLGGGRGYSLDDLDMQLKPTNQVLPDFVAKVETYKPDLLLFSTVEDTLKDTTLMLEAVSHLNIPHIVGGVLPINDPELCLKQDHINVICRYEGELVLSEVIDRFDKDWLSTRGIWYKHENKIYKNNFQPLVDINNIVPDYSLYSKNRFNRPIGGKVRTTVQFETYRGCPYSCTFCNSPMTREINKHYLRRKNIESLEKELDYYVETLDPEYFFIIDDSFLARPKKEIFDVCKLLQKYRLPWWNNTRLENVDKDILQAMKDSLCDRIQFGIECGNEKYRKEVLFRNVTNDTYYKKADILNDSNIPYGLNAIIGLPGETKQMVFETIELIREIEGYDGIGVSIFIPYRGTKLREYAVTKGWLHKDWVSGQGYLHGGSALNMPKPYLQNKEIVDLSLKFKHYCYFDKKLWSEIDHASDLQKFEDIYNKEFYTKYAIGGNSHKLRRLNSVFACVSSPQTDIHNIFAN